MSVPIKISDRLNKIIPVVKILKICFQSLSEINQNISKTGNILTEIAKTNNIALYHFLLLLYSLIYS